MIVSRTQKGDTMCTILKIALGTSQQQVGMRIPILEANYSRYGFLLGDGWNKKLWLFLNEIGGTIKILGVWILSIQLKNLRL